MSDKVNQSVINAQSQEEVDSNPQGSAIWFTAQRPRTAQRDLGRYVKASFAHPGKMLPDLASTILDTYGRTGDVWCDPMCGIGTVLIEAMYRGYGAYGIEWEEHWKDVCQANINLAVTHAAPGWGTIFQGDARKFPPVISGAAVDKIAFSPPYGNTLSKTAHGPDLHPHRQQGGKRAAKAIRHGYSSIATEETAAIPDAPGDMTLRATGSDINLGDLKHGAVADAIAVAGALKAGTPLQDDGPHTYLKEMAKVYHQCFLALKPEGLMILVLRDYRRDKRRVDLLGDTVDICEALGFLYHDRIAALQCPVATNNGDVAPKPQGAIAFWTIENCKKADPPLMVPIFEDVVVFRKPTPPSRSSTRKKSHG